MLVLSPHLSHVLGVLPPLCHHVGTFAHIVVSGCSLRKEAAPGAGCEAFYCLQSKQSGHVRSLK